MKSSGLRSLLLGFSGSVLLSALAGAALAATPVLTHVAAAQLFTAVVPLGDPDNGSQDFFGSSVSLSADGNTALVGSPGASAGGARLAGKAYVFQRNGGSWGAAPVATFTEPGTPANDEFGFSVALSADGNTALVGSCCTATGGHAGAGAAYVFTRAGTWATTPAATLTEPTPGANDHFGVNVALAGNTALVGAPDSNGSTGAAYVFTESAGNWTGAATLNGTSSGGGFGTAVALSADAGTALVGAPKAGSGAGTASVFTASGGVWSTTPAVALVNPGSGTDGFGSSTTLGNGMALIGAPHTMQGSSADAGAAYLFTATGGVWATTPGTTFTEATLGAGDQFGVSLALSADNGTAFIGARNGASASSSYLYTRSGGVWATQPLATFSKPDPLADANFSSSVALSGNGGSALLGAPNIAYAIDAAASDLLALAMSGAPGSVDVGQTVTYSFTVTNNSGAAVTGVSLADSLPAQLSFSSASGAGGNCNAAGAVVTCTLDSLQPGATWQPTLTVNAKTAGTVSDSASVSATAPDPFTADNSASVSTTVKTAGGSSGGGGGGGAFGALSLLLLGALAGRRRSRI